MNYYEHHIGDYDKNTSHLTACEDGIYCRLIRRYYDKERPLPADTTEVKRLARARTPEERRAVDSVLREFFVLEEDGWHHSKCDEIIAAFQAAEPEREAKKRNEDTRLARHRAERAALFAALNAAGQHMPYNAPIADVRAAAARITTQSATGTATQNGPPATPLETGTATPATATQAPDTSPQSPVAIHQTPEDGEQPPQPPTPAAAVTKALRSAGIASANPSHPTLLVLLEAGATVDEFLAAVPSTENKRDRFSYLLSVVAGRRQDAATAGKAIHRGPLPNGAASDREALIAATQAKLAQSRTTTTTEELPHA